MRVAVVGTGYVGLVTGVCLAEWATTSSAWTSTQDKVAGSSGASRPSTSGVSRSCCGATSAAADRDHRSGAAVPAAT